MAGLIPQSFLDELLARIDIVELIDQRVPLKKAGANHKACCPFHSEKSPSFTVSESKQFYHCFGCGAHGNAIGFLMEYDRLEFPDAVEELAGRLGLEVPRDENAPDRPRVDPSLYELMAKAARFFQQQLRQHERGKLAVDYLKDRGLTGEIAKNFEIGYAPPDWHSLESLFGRDAAIRQQLVTCGLLIKNDDGNIYDRFRDRIMFPIRDKRGRVIGFGGRIIDQGEPKYLNSPETPIFHKGHEVYGLYEARQSNRKLDRIILVEGYMDVVALAQFGVTNAIATLGTATSGHHLQQLFRDTSELVFCFDGDRAGRDAAMRALDNSLPLLRGGRNIKLHFLPDGEDPDTLIRQIGKDAFLERLEQSPSLFEFLIGHLSGQVDLDTVAGRGQLVHLARPYLDKVTDPVYRELWQQQLATTAGLSEDKLNRLLAGESQPARQPSATISRSKPSKPGKGSSMSPVRLALWLLLQEPTLAGRVAHIDWLAGLDEPGAKVLHRMLELLRANPNLTTGALLEHWRGTKTGEALSGLAIQTRDVNGAEAEEFDACIRKLLTFAREQRLKVLEQKTSGAGLNPAEKAEYQQLLQMRRDRV